MKSDTPLPLVTINIGWSNKSPTTGTLNKLPVDTSVRNCPYTEDYQESSQLLLTISPVDAKNNSLFVTVFKRARKVCATVPFSSSLSPTHINCLNCCFQVLSSGPKPSPLLFFLFSLVLQLQTHGTGVTWGRSYNLLSLTFLLIN